jgi:hypothetical protein
MGTEDLKKQLQEAENAYMQESLNLIQSLCEDRGIVIFGILNNVRVGIEGTIVTDWAIRKK